MLLDEEPICPGAVNCTEIGSRLNEPHLVSLEIGPWPSYIAIVSSSFSCLGSLLIVITYFALKDIRTGAQKIITLLAVADFISAAGYIMGSINFLTHFNQTSKSSCGVFERVCLGQATITSWSSLVSFWWTVILAFYFCLIMVFRRLQLAGKLMPLYSIIAWGSPLLIVIPLFATGNLGYAPYAASNWCFVKVRNYSNPNLHSDGLTIFIVFMAGKLWEILSYAIVTILYIIIIVHMGRTRRRIGNGVLDPKLIQVESRLLAIPILFVLLRIWGTLQFIVSLGVAGTIHEGCVPNSVHVAFVVLGILQAIGDSGQGWGNAILYVFVSPTIRTKLIETCCGTCLDAIEEGHHPDHTNTETHTRTNRSSLNKNNRKQINVHEDASSESEPLIPSSPAIGYNIKRYNTTTTCTVTDGAEMIHRLTSEAEMERSNMSTAT